MKAYAGTTGVLLAMNVAPERRDDLLGFAIHREGGNRPAHGLKGEMTGSREGTAVSYFRRRGRVRRQDPLEALQVRSVFR